VALSLVGFFFARLSESTLASLTSLEGLTKKGNKKNRKKIEKALAQAREMLAGVGLQM
jgi:hypothetical protein